MSPGIHLLSNKVPGYGLSEGSCLPCSGISGRSALSPYSCHGDYKPVSGLKIPLSKNLVCGPRRVSLVCKASSGGHRRNPDFSRQNKQGTGFSKSKNKQNQEKDDPESFEETEILSSKNGPLLSLSGSPRFQATATPGPREKEIVELFRKVQAQLRERAAIKEEKRIEALQGQGERGTVDSLLKLLRKHSVEQGKRRTGGEDFNLDQSERTNSLNAEPNSSFFDSSSLTAEQVQEPSPTSFTRPASNFRRKSPVPRVKYQPVYSTDENSTSSSPAIASSSQQKSQVKRKKSSIQPEPEPIPSDVPDEVLDEVSDSYDADEVISDSSDVDEADDASVESSTAEQTDLSSLKLSELRVLAKSRGVKGYSKLKKGELVEFLTQVTI